MEVCVYRIRESWLADMIPSGWSTQILVIMFVEHRNV